MTSSVGRPPEFLQVGLRCGLVHPGVHGRADLPVGSVGPHHQLEDGPVPAALRRHRRGDPGRVAAPAAYRCSGVPPSCRNRLVSFVEENQRSECEHESVFFTYLYFFWCYEKNSRPHPLMMQDHCQSIKTEPPPLSGFLLLASS